MANSKDIPGVIAPPPLIAAGTLLLGLALDWLLPSAVLAGLLPVSARVVIGLVLIVGGGALSFIGSRTFTQAGTNVPPWEPALKLVTTGPYQWLRNPMYVGGIGLLAGIAILIASDWLLVLLVPAGLLLHYGVVLREERYLARKFGESYRQYKATVPRYGLPF